MKHFFIACLLLATYCLLPSFSFSQPCTSWTINHQADIPSACNQMTMTMNFDAMGRQYLYVANKEAGLKIYDISVISTPSLVATVPISQYDSLHVMNLFQVGNYVYLALGNTFAASKTGMAIVDVTNPSTPSVTDYWVLPSSTSGAGIVKVEGNYAYLGAMGHGLVVLDVTAKNNIQFVSQFIPDINWPVNNPTASLYNARGMEVRNSIVYLCYDAGGIRIINCINKLAPKETGRWCNPAMYTPINRPRAYNNIVLDGNLAYVAVDYAGMEVLNISDTSNIAMTGWWNPYNAPTNNWFTSPSHTNELVHIPNCYLVLMSTGKSDMMVVDVSNPAAPDSCNFYGGVSNGIGTWGIARNHMGKLALSYICTLGIPFASNWTGVKLFNYGVGCIIGSSEEITDADIVIFPIPAKDHLKIKMKGGFEPSGVVITNLLGQNFHPVIRCSENETNVNVSGLNRGLYFIKWSSGGREFVRKFTKE